MINKNTTATFPPLNKIRSKQILELIYSDIWGPALVTAKFGYKYMLTIFDDYSQRTFIYPMRTKDEVFVKIKNFITFIECQINKKVRVLRCSFYLFILFLLTEGLCIIYEIQFHVWIIGIF